MDRGDEFLKKYRAVDNEIIRKYHLSDDSEDSGFKYLEHQKDWAFMKEDLQYCRKLRNFFSHKDNIEGHYPVVPTDGLMDFLDTVIDKVHHPAKAENIMVKARYMKTRKMTDSVRETMEMMLKNSFTHVPIVNDLGLVTGVFSENTLLRYLIDDKIVEIDDDKTFAEIGEKYLGFSNHKTEKFDFIARDTMLTEIKEMFSEALSTDRRVGMLFVTQNGSPKERPLGIVTLWDVAGKDYTLI